MKGLRRLTSLYFSGQFGRFLVAGGLALVVNWLSRFLFNLYVGYGWAIVMAYLIGILVAFVLNKTFVFPFSERSVGFELSCFFAVNVAAFPIVWVVAFVLGEWVLRSWLAPDPAFALAHGTALTLPALVNFVIHKFITFRGA